MSALPLIAGFPELLENLRNMTDKEDGMAPHNYLKLWLNEKRRTVNLQARIEELKTYIEEAERTLARSVERKTAERVVKTAYDKGQLKGKKELEERLVFP